VERIREGHRAELDRRSPAPLDVQEHSLVAARATDVDSKTPFSGIFGLSRSPPDLIIGVGAPAASFIQRNRQQLFPATPVLFTTLEARRVQYSSLTDNVTVVAVTHRFLVLFESFLKISPARPSSGFSSLIISSRQNHSFGESPLTMAMVFQGRDQVVRQALL
jgi:hypothetical protein